MQPILRTRGELNTRPELWELRRKLPLILDTVGYKRNDFVWLEQMKPIALLVSENWYATAEPRRGPQRWRPERDNSAAPPSRPLRHVVKCDRDSMHGTSCSQVVTTPKLRVGVFRNNLLKPQEHNPNSLLPRSLLDRSLLICWRTAPWLAGAQLFWPHLG